MDTQQRPWTGRTAGSWGSTGTGTRRRAAWGTDRTARRRARRLSRALEEGDDGRSRGAPAPDRRGADADLSRHEGRSAADEPSDSAGLTAEPPGFRAAPSASMRPDVGKM